MTNWQAIVERCKADLVDLSDIKGDNQVGITLVVNSRSRAVLALAEAEKMAEREEPQLKKLFDDKHYGVFRHVGSSPTCSCGRTKAWVSDLSGALNNGHYACEVCDPITVDDWKCGHCGSEDCQFSRTVESGEDGSEKWGHYYCGQCGKEAE